MGEWGTGLLGQVGCLLGAALDVGAQKSGLLPRPWAISRKWNSDRTCVMITTLTVRRRIVNFTCNAKGHGAQRSSLRAEESKRK